MNTNGALNGNGTPKPNGLLNGNGSLRTAQTKTKRSWLNSDLRYGILVYGSMAVIISGLGLWNHYHPQPPTPVDPRTVQIEKTIANLYDAIDVLQDELPPPDDDHRQGEW